jgi:hypothetical protein
VPFHLEFCPHCHARVGFPSANPIEQASPEENEESEKSEPSSPATPATNGAELSAMADLFAKMAGASLLWPLIAGGATFIRGVGTGYGQALSLLLGLAPAIGGLILFFAASTSLRSAARRNGESSGVLLGVLWGVAGMAVWGYFFNLFFLKS